MTEEEKIKWEQHDLTKYLATGGKSGKMPQEYVMLHIAGHFGMSIEQVETMPKLWMTRATAYVLAAFKAKELMIAEKERRSSD